MKPETDAEFLNRLTEIWRLKDQRAQERMQPGFPPSDGFNRYKARNKHLADIEFVNQNKA
jgi:hypothetical protein